MKDKEFPKSYYRSTCSCCGSTVTTEARKLPDNNNSEGNLCCSCYERQALDAWFEMAEMFDLVASSLKNPISIVKWTYLEDYLKWHHCQKLMAKGIIKYQIL